MLVTKDIKTAKLKGQAKYHNLRLDSANQNIFADKSKTGLKDCLDEMLSSFIWLG